MDPIDYTSAFSNLPSPSQAMLQGVQSGAAVQQLQAQQQQQQLARARQQQMNSDLANLSANPSTDAIAQMSVKYPELGKQMKESFDMLAPAQKQAKLDRATQVYAALQSDAPDVAQKVLSDQATALRNSGNEQDAQAAETMRDLIGQHPDFAKTTAGLMLSSAMGPDKFTTAFTGLGTEQRAADLAPAALTEANAKAAGAEADAYQKNLGVVGQTLGALQGKSAKPAQAQTALKSLAARGFISKEELPGYLAAVPSDQKQLDQWLGSMKLSGMKPDDQMKYTTPTAGEVLQSNTSKYAVDSSARTAAARLSFDKDQANAEDAPDTTSDKEKQLWVHQYVAGNGSVPRSAPAAVRNHIGTWAAEMGITPADLSSGAAQAKFDQATAVTSGHRAGSMASVEATMPALTANARDLSHQLDQGKFVPLNQLIQMANDKISDPKLAAFKVAHQAVVSEYQQVISRGGTNVTALREAMHALNSARSAQAYDAALNQVDKEVAINVAGSHAVRAGLGGQHGATPAAAPAIPAGWTVKEH